MPSVGSYLLPRAGVVSAGSLNRLQDTPSGLQNLNTKADMGTGGSTTRRFVPDTTTSTVRTVPSVGAAPAGEGWRIDPADMAIPAGGSRFYAAGNFTVVPSIHFSAATTGQTWTLTMVLYATEAGVTTEVGRAASSVTRTTLVPGTNTLPTKTITVGRNLVFTQEGDTLQAEFYITGPGIITGLVISLSLEVFVADTHPTYIASPIPGLQTAGAPMGSTRWISAPWAPTPPPADDEDALAALTLALV